VIVIPTREYIFRLVIDQSLYRSGVGLIARGVLDNYCRILRALDNALMLGEQRHSTLDIRRRLRFIDQIKITSVVLWSMRLHLLNLTPYDSGIFPQASTGSVGVAQLSFDR
jgi:hypothetical protein